MADPEQSAKPRVFVSYSRRDCSAFVQDLLAGLELLDFAPSFDKQDIAAGEDWEARLGALIQESDTVVFVISPEAVKSPRCAWEVDKAVELAKRIIPIVALAVSEEDVPAKLKQLNYIHFNEAHTFARALGLLGKTLNTDIDWIREHTRLAGLVARWQHRGRADALLLRGLEFEAAAAWSARWKAGAPEITEAQHAFIAASSEAEVARTNKERQQLAEVAKAQTARAEALAEREIIVQKLSRRTALGLVGAGTLTVAAAGLAYWGIDAERRFRSARELAAEAQRHSIDEAIRKEAMRTDIKGQLVAYAAPPGGLAQDGKEGGNSPFTTAVLTALKDPGTPLQLALTQAVKRVMADTENRQRPFLSTDMGGDIYFERQPPTRRRKALVFSVDRLGERTDVRFPNVERDALAWEALLNSAGFEVARLVNPKKADVKMGLAGVTFDELAKRRAQGDPVLPRVSFLPAGFKQEKPAVEPPDNTLAVLFFAGAGLVARGDDYLVLADTKVDTESAVVDSALNVPEVQELLRRTAAASVIVLDTNFTRAFDRSRR